MYCNAILLSLVPAPVKLIVTSQAAAKPGPLDADLQTGACAAGYKKIVCEGLKTVRWN